MLDRYGFVAEADSANLFLVKAGEIHTPVPTACLHGITRAIVIREARAAGFAMAERNVSLTDLHAADEVFLTGTIAEIVPVIDVDGRRIGTGAPGPVTLRISDLYRRLTEAQGVSIPGAVLMSVAEADGDADGQGHRKQGA